MRLLVVEDEEHLRIGLKFNFEIEGFQVDVAEDGKGAMELLEADPKAYGAVVLDLMLPGMSGYDVLEKMREIDPTLPVLILTARTQSEDKTRAFDIGTDQYMTKPFNLTELLSRVRNLLAKRKAYLAAVGSPGPSTTEPSGEEVGVFRFDDCEVNFETFEVTVRGQSVKLTQIEMQLLRYFVSNEGRVLSRQQILEEVWGHQYVPTTRTVDNFLLRLRKHFEKDPANPRHFLSVRSAGYRFVASPRDANPDLG